VQEGEINKSVERWQDLNLKERSAVVTGAARGIGRATAFRLAGLGARTAIWDLDADQARETAAELRQALASQGRPAQVDSREVDVTDADRVTAAMDEFAGDAGLDVLVNNAGTTSVQSAETMPLEVWEQTIRINLTGAFYCCRAAIPHLRKRPGSAIVNISSSSALVGGGGGAHYAASKAGLEGLTRQLARELAPDIRVNAIQPRTIETDLFSARYAHAPNDRDDLRSHIPLGRFGSVDDIATTVAFLASNWSSYMTGQILLVDGGRTHQ
jgi:NAD(P)-dependent dehydrogenase (short-subunit alcohol dehydrogenase family)